MKDDVEFSGETSDFFLLKPERGINRVICFSENHSLTLPEMEVDDIKSR
jgi:UDPglucose--hexose-1-phosphate uridylyltransferase